MTAKPQEPRAATLLRFLIPDSQPYAAMLPCKPDRAERSLPMDKVVRA